MNRFIFLIKSIACLIALLCLTDVGYASPQSSTENNVHAFCLPLDFEDLRTRDSLYAATKHALNLNVGEPRTVRMIYFLPNDRPFRQEVVDSMKVVIRQVQTFYAEQMEAHGYGRKTFRFETDAQGDPVVHHMDGQHPDSYYLDVYRSYLQEIEQKFDTRANNVYLIVLDNSTGTIDGASGKGTGGRDSGYAAVTSRTGWITIAHELGHAFGLWHDFRDGAYIMSYGFEQNSLSMCHAEFLAVHPYFNTDSEDKGTPSPTIELISPNEYPTGSTSVPVRLKVSDPDGLHQVLLFVNSRGGFARGSYEVKACRGLSGEKDAVVQFDYDGVVPSDGSTSLSDPLIHPINVCAVDSFGNVAYTDFVLLDDSTHRDPIATFEGGLTASVAFSPDGSILASALSDGTVKLWDVATRRNIATLEGHGSQDNFIAFSPDGSILASALSDGTVKLWDVSTRRNIATLEGHGSWVNSIAFSPNGSILASALSDGTVELWDVSTRRNIATLEGHAWIYSIAFSPDGSILASAPSDGTVELWDVATRRNIATLEGRGSWYNSVAFSPDGSILASGSYDGTVELWNVATMSRVLTIKGHRIWANSVAFSPDGSILASGSYDGTVKLWDMSEWTRPRPFGLVKISGNNQQGTSGAELTSPLVVELRDQYGSALALKGVPVTFTVTAGNGRIGGKFTVENATTDANGRAQITLTLGPYPGTNTVEVSIGAKRVTFNAVGVGTPEMPIMGGDYRTWHLPDGVIARLGKGAIGESDRAVAFSPDGQCLAVASGIGVWLYEVATSRLLALLSSERVVHSVVFSPDGRMLVSGLDNGGVELWEVETGTKVAMFEGHSDRVTSVVFSPDGTRLASGSKGQVIKLWNVAKREVVGTWKVAEVNSSFYSNSVVFSPDGTTLVSGFQDGTVRLWDVATQTTIATLEGHIGGVVSVSFSPDGTMLASGSKDQVRLWDVATRHTIATFGGHRSWISSVSFSPMGTILASGSRDHTVKLWDVATRRTIATLEQESWRPTTFNSMSFSPDGTMLASGSGGEVRLWDVETRNIAILSGHMPLHSMAFSPTGTILASGSRGEVRLWDVVTQMTIATLEGYTGNVNSVSFSPDGTMLAIVGSWFEIGLWDVATRRTIATLEGHVPYEVYFVSFSPDGTMLASGSWQEVRLWDVATQTTIATLEGHIGSVESISFSPDGTILAIGSGGRVGLWDVATRRTIATLEGHVPYEVYFVSFSPDGTMLASGSWQEVGLWDVATQTTIATLEGHIGGVESISFSPDGTALASGSWGGTVRLWDVATRTTIATLEGHSGSVNSVSFSFDGTTLASGSGDGTILLWDMSPYITPQTPASAPTPDFDGDGTVGISDFLQFVEQFGFSQGDEGYEARFDLDGNGVIGISDFLIFVDNFGKKVS